MVTTSAQSKINSISQYASKSGQNVADALLQSVDPLVTFIIEHITPLIQSLVADHVIAMRRQLLSGDEFLTVRQAARRFGISVPTLYVWIDKGIINALRIEGKIFVSISEVGFAKESVYQPAKATKKAVGQQEESFNSEPLPPITDTLPPEIAVRDGLPYFPALDRTGSMDSV